jgi:hypothetical protein
MSGFINGVIQYLVSRNNSDRGYEDEYGCGQTRMLSNYSPKQ